MEEQKSCGIPVTNYRSIWLPIIEEAGYNVFKSKERVICCKTLQFRRSKVKSVTSTTK
jgi:hypothetical protein